MGRGYSLYVLLNEIQTMFPQLARQPRDLFTDHPLNNQRSVVLRKKNLKREIEGQTISLYYILVILKGIDFHVTVYHFSDIVFALHFLLNSFPCRV